jgi:hypothetical protein
VKTAIGVCPREREWSAVHYGPIRLICGADFACSMLQVVEGFGGASRDRTDDLIVANSQPCARSSDCEEVRMTQMGSIHAGLFAILCPAPVPERQRPTPPDAGRDGRVTTQTTTQNSTQGEGAVLSCPSGVRAGRWRRLSTRSRTLQFLLFSERGSLRTASPPHGAHPESEFVCSRGTAFSTSASRLTLAPQFGVLTWPEACPKKLELENLGGLVTESKLTRIQVRRDN